MFIFQINSNPGNFVIMAASNKDETGSIEEILAQDLKGAHLDEVTRVLYGKRLRYVEKSQRDHNMLVDRRPITIDANAAKMAEANNFQLTGYVFEARPEQLRSPRMVTGLL